MELDGKEKNKLRVNLELRLQEQIYKIKNLCIDLDSNKVILWMILL